MSNPIKLSNLFGKEVANGALQTTTSAGVTYTVKPTSVPEGGRLINVHRPDGGHKTLVQKPDGSRHKNSHQNKKW
jgi:hypothetical protein